MHQAKWPLGKTLCEKGLVIPPRPPFTKGGRRRLKPYYGAGRLGGFEVNVRREKKKETLKTLRKEENLKCLKELSSFCHC